MTNLPVNNQTQLDLISMEAGHPTAVTDRAINVLIAMHDHVLTDARRKTFIERQLSVFNNNERAHVESVVNAVIGWRHA